jgi:adenosylhomocysteine nucleosidase
MLAPMRSELQPIVRLLSLTRSAEHPRRGVTSLYEGRVGQTQVIATTIGVGPKSAARTTEGILADLSVDHVVVCGIAGAVGSDLEIGTLVVPDLVIDGTTRAGFRPDPLGGLTQKGTILTAGELVLDPGVLDQLRADGVVALDMESAAVGEVCGKLGQRWTVFRSISDRANDGMVDDAVLGLLNEDGSVDLKASARLILRHPGKVPRLVKLAKDSANAARVAAKAAIAALSS